MTKTKLFNILRRFIIAFFICLFSLQVSSQNSYRWERIDSVSKTKSQIYSDTKMFIAETWKSSKDVIQNDDKENGIILVKGVISKFGGGVLNTGKFWYSYNVKFYIKEQKYRIVIDNFVFDSADTPNRKAQVAEEYPGGWNCSLSKNQWTDLMISLKVDMQGIVNSYTKFIRGASPNNDW